MRPFKYPPKLVDSSLLISLALTNSIVAGASVILSTLFFAVTVVVSTSRAEGSINKSNVYSLSISTNISVLYSLYPIYKTFKVYLQVSQAGILLMR